MVQHPLDACPSPSAVSSKLSTGYISLTDRQGAVVHEQLMIGAPGMISLQLSDQIKGLAAKPLRYSLLARMARIVVNSMYAAAQRVSFSLCKVLLP